MRLLVPLLLFFVLAGCERAGDAASLVLQSYSFDTSAEGWRIAGDTVDVEPVHRANGGQAGGYISSADEALGETWYFTAPAEVLAHLPKAENGVLRYSLKQSATGADILDDDIVIQGPAGRLSYRFATPPGTDWTEYSVQLSASAGWRWNWNANATQEHLRSVLQQPTRLHIRGEYVTGPDEGGLDTVVLSAAPTRSPRADGL